MTSIVHLSDLHFGRSRPSLIEPLFEAVTARNPRLVVISGDLTQRARASEFREARSFLRRLPYPVLPVPGNHDIPLYALFVRLVNPFRNYQRAISPILEPQYMDNEIAAIGINTVRRLKWKDGRINARQLEAVRVFFSGVSKNALKIVIAHHPFNLPEGYPGTFIDRAQIALECFEKSGVDLLLSGHLHSTLARYHSAEFRLQSRKLLIIQAGTPISTRLRREPNSFNVIRAVDRDIRVDRLEFDPGPQAFLLSSEERVIRTEHGWERTKEM